MKVSRLAKSIKPGESILIGSGGWYKVESVEENEGLGKVLLHVKNGQNEDDVIVLPINAKFTNEIK